MMCLCAFNALLYVCCKLSVSTVYCFNKVRDVLSHDFTQYSASILKIWWEVAKSEATVAKAS